MYSDVNLSHLVPHLVFLCLLVCCLKFLCLFLCSSHRCTEPAHVVATSAFFEVVVLNKMED